MLVARVKADSAKNLPGSEMTVRPGSFMKYCWRADLTTFEASSKCGPAVKPPPIFSTCILGKPSREAASKMVFAAAMAAR
ncbi:hypothetical protein RHGRI_015826 [Rhododendron griersonianum]|uniref:Uncharacterized protein n=1 Tax=Rhododendron griersonianum TaxID=479676 RepID=A0AAV6JNW4_9ERIC|nr:hypothetical protein RHGRI_015826 [Rhododendron griersonianum]